MATHRTVGLVVLFNHNYENNIPIIKRLYKERFPHLRILMPFYYGNDDEVIGVFGTSFTFQSYIAQAREELLRMGCDDFLIIGDDLLLNPDIDSLNLHEKLHIPGGSFYIDKVENVSECSYSRPLLEADRFSPYIPGLDGSANRNVPSYEEAYKILSEKGLINTTKLSKWKPFYPAFLPFSFSTLHKNYKILKARVYHLLKVLQYKLCPARMPYPYIFGYSDILLIPKERLLDLCLYLEPFASWNMFVEMAIPTAIMLLPDTNVCFAEGTPYKTGNVWYPQHPVHFNKINGLINNLLQNAKEIESLGSFFPKEYLYLHPVKLSRYKKHHDLPVSSQ